MTLVFLTLMRMPTVVNSSKHALHLAIVTDQDHDVVVIDEFGFMDVGSSANPLVILLDLFTKPIVKRGRAHTFVKRRGEPQRILLLSSPFVLTLILVDT